MASDAPQVLVRLRTICEIDEWANNHGIGRSSAINMMCMTVLDAERESGREIQLPPPDDRELPEKAHVRLKAIPLIDEFADRHDRSRWDAIDAMCKIYMEAEKEMKGWMVNVPNNS